MAMRKPIRLGPNDHADPRRPRVQRDALLISEGEALIYARDPTKTARHVIENLLDNVTADA